MALQLDISSQKFHAGNMTHMVFGKFCFRLATEVRLYKGDKIEAVAEGLAVTFKNSGLRRIIPIAPFPDGYATEPTD